MNPNTRPLRLAALVLCAAPALAGDTNPPAGPVTNTMKTLADVEPRIPISSIPVIIAGSGSYYLTGDLTGTSGLHGLIITAADVTIDLNGFTLIGVPGSSDAVNSTGHATTIRNGTIRDWGNNGVDLSGTGQGVIEDVLIRDCSGVGCSLGAGVIRDCNAEGNANAGFFIGNGRIERCTATGNSFHNFSINCCSTVTDCYSISALGAATDGFNAGVNVVFRNCVSTASSDDGFQAGADCSFTNCQAFSNSDRGFSLSNGTLVSGCVANGNSGNGIYAVEGCSIINCTSMANGANGIVAVRESMVIGCMASGHTSGAGIDVSADCTVTQCTATGNLDGIDAGARCAITLSTSNLNTNDGVSAANSLIRGNTIVNNFGTNINATTSTVLENHP